MVSTVGEYVPDEGVREIIANSRGIRLQGKGDERLADYMEKIGYESIGFRRTYETMVFKVEGVCDAPECDCGQPMPKNWQEVDSDGYNSKFAANDGHYRMCLKFASMAVPTT
ncbi:MAG: hypothetical protein K2X93_23010 [Candidatus Obscuribacterales bacterium]|nr:hypothetical protein [Candidatus Obscuribacterales bacterium]